MYPFYWTSSERGIFMRYTYEFKKKAVELYRQGKIRPFCRTNIHIVLDYS